MNDVSETKVDPERLRKQFTALWPTLEQKLSVIKDDPPAYSTRSKDSVVEDLFLYIKDLTRRFAALGTC